ncbi:glutathione S-transferase family protein [Sphingopyxis sp. OPL5]|uniref:glutathione S-transferase family protein n=1 Tax=Sphingopyxis sp. OPL5 TaxID=2486273 RepID=UPI00164E4D0E|nr:glutathione S-transferase family protein [Sphingopyxis sp. OPL5]QNO27217.1 glutathione S-transferase family protein [Sphingopyxis sp. OPL5]
MTKVAFYMDLAGIDYQLVGANPFTLKADTPHGKLPTIEDDDGTIVADSTAIIRHFEASRSEPLDRGADARERAQMMAFNRLLDEHFYWSAVIQPRWREQANWETYVPIICGGNQPDASLRNELETFRRMVLGEFDGQGMGRLNAEQVYARARQDVDALAGQLGDQPYFMGDKPRSIDANVLSLLKHTLETPFIFDTKDYVASKPNLVAYVERLRARISDVSKKAA